MYEERLKRIEWWVEAISTGELADLANKEVVEKLLVALLAEAGAVTLMQRKSPE